MDKLDWVLFSILTLAVIALYVKGKQTGKKLKECEERM